jgi:hypothetical protein
MTPRYFASAPPDRAVALDQSHIDVEAPVDLAVVMNWNDVAAVRRPARPT